MAQIMKSDDPLLGPLKFAANHAGECALAVIISTQGPSYRSVGSVMAVAQDRSVCGSLSSGCIEADIIHHAMLAMETGVPEIICYGQGAPIIDLRLPCGGAMEVLIVPRPDHAVLKTALQGFEARIPQTVQINLRNGAMQIYSGDYEAADAEHFCLKLEPQLAFCIFGNGAEVFNFAALADSLGYKTSVYTPDLEALQKLQSQGISAQHLKTINAVPPLILDRWTAAVLFFHDHDWEPAILLKMLESEAFYIGAQGSYLARQNRDADLLAMGIEPEKIDRIVGPVGLIPSVRDPRSLAVSVLAQVLAFEKERAV
jgi:xanthine dehydrogenase accessory factor